LGGYRNRLLALCRRIGESVRDLRDDPPEAPDSHGGAPETWTDAADLSVREYEEQVDVALAGTEKNLLGQVEAALVRIDAGTFGRCTACAGSIDAERLRTLPYTASCADCARGNESARR